MYDITVILPTLNEAENIGSTIDVIEQVFTNADITGELLVVDDNSRDDTIAIVQQRQQEYANIHYLVRTADHGLSRSIIDGIACAQADNVLVTDADLQHDVTLIPSFLDALNRHDLVIGSRYMPGGGIEQWAMKRRIISIGATALGRLLFPDITDPVSGFFALRKSVVAGVEMRGRGYKLCMDILTKGTYTSVCEIPYTFTTRNKGESKLNMTTIKEYALQVGELVAYTVHHPSHIRDEWQKLVRFSIVGASGVIVNWGAYAMFAHIVGIPTLVAAISAIEISIISNFLLNDRWTFDRSGHRVRRFVAFQSISMGGMAIQMLTFFALLGWWGNDLDLVVYPLGIGVAFIWNYLGNRHLTWRT